MITKNSQKKQRSVLTTVNMRVITRIEQREGEMNRQRFRFSPRLLVNNLALTQKGAMTYDVA